MKQEIVNSRANQRQGQKRIKRAVCQPIGQNYISDVDGDE